MRLLDFDYDLPKGLIAQEPARPRDSSRLMVLDEGFSHRGFADFISYLEKGDVLVLNNSRVVPARLLGFKDTGGRVEMLLVKKIGGDVWLCLARGRKLKKGTRLTFSDDLSGVVREKVDGRFVIEFIFEGVFDGVLDEVGEMPTPPYIKHSLGSKDEYQTVYALHDGSIAAPTAGFHFTPIVLDRIRALGVGVVFLTLHVGLGTFLPVKVDDVEEHQMEEEYFVISDEVAEAINDRSGRLFVVGTTSVRALESASDESGKIVKGEGFTDLFIYPGYQFKMDISGLLTNFHLPRSTLLMLVSAFAGRERILGAYREAVSLGYRFYSFGDAMLILK